MGVKISKPAINIREALTEASAVVPYEQRQFHFDNLVTNGTFDTDVSGWTGNNATLSLSSDRLRVTDNGSSAYAYQVITVEPGKTYKLTFDYLFPSANTATDYEVNIRNTNQSGSILKGLNTVTTTWVEDVLSSNSLVFTPTTSTVGLTLASASTTGDYADFDNISVYTSDGTDVAFTMPKGWKPLHVYDDGVLQREGSAEDYEVTFDGFNYYVKPTVANPGARNTVIGVRA